MAIPPIQLSVNYVIYNATTGQISKSGQCLPFELATQHLEDGEAITVVLPDGITDDLYYMKDGMFYPRPEMNVQDRYEIALDSGLVSFAVPDGTQVILNHRATIIDDGTFEFGSSEVGHYNFTIVPPFPLRQKTFEVIVS